ncbi:MAG: phospho-N-acetylmuramoyl-pentapeptide-transferase [Bacteroidetes bacterium]|jgi:phospho-N-acetylmuramoyl-pentapeptide-transferase|nr:phospho-N-acetylmuramoyl-pentapeptide-transferase [Bacteroidota bacterium]MBT6684739.1 phospho-N-acetylmuramoyl-pentapeptide-transferase [Bacteroidota bacterium]MBT7143840.1 phospho-N-acetylmuramoyl-pentapeptide-transferase [Bacteroidota bacterium]MBT7489979.1 phospho-N-acetylmuramoyl-pentapeptide-transferase [Bacteroidota bacterium]
MLYHLFLYLDQFDIPGAGMFKYITFRSAMAVITSLILSMLYGKKIINVLQKKQIGETIRDLDLEGQMQKKGTPTMGGLIILGSILIPTLLFADITNIYIILLIITTVWLGIIGFVDDYIKVFKKNKEGLRSRSKIIGQVGLGFIVGVTMFFSSDIVVREKAELPIENDTELIQNSAQKTEITDFFSNEKKSTKTTIPFFKNNEFDYSWIVSFLGEKGRKYGVWIVFIIIVIFIITAVSNGANLTDGLDGLATGVSAITASILGILAYVSSNFILANYLNIMFIPNSAELVIFASALFGSTVGFLWFNSYPAQVFMGDTGSLALGGIIAVFAIVIRKELLIPILCGIFLIENISVILQVTYFKYTKKKFGAGRRIFKMAPLHHHYQKLGYPESKIVLRFWIVGILLAVITIVTLKIR